MISMLVPDLHLHSTASDGVLPPGAVIHRALAAGVNTVALTDHDSLQGLDTAQRAALSAGMQFIPGIEISAGGQDEIHILGYHISGNSLGLLQLIQALRADRENRVHRFLESLQKEGIDVSIDELDIPEGTAFSRPLLARAMVKKGYVSSVAEAFDRYIGIGKPCYVPRKLFHVGDVIAVLRADGAVPVLAHPALIKIPPAELQDMLNGWISAGLMGIEVYHPAHDDLTCQGWEDYARQHSLLVTGGSDFHGDQAPLHAEIGAMIPRWVTHNDDAQRLLQYAAVPDQ